jgi:hypothetical protein
MKKFYFLHIQKTSGRFCKENVIVPLWDILTSNNVFVYLNPSHPNWDKNFIDEKTFIFCLFRDPVKRTISHYCHDMVLGSQAERLVPVGTSPHINRESFLKWLNENKIWLSNYQSKNILLEDPEMNYDIVKYFSFDLSDTDKIKILERIKRINLFVRSENLDKNFCLNAQNKILKFFNFSIKNKNDEFENKEDFYNEDSYNLFNLLKQEDLDYIRSINEFDNYIHKEDEFFTKEYV